MLFSAHVQHKAAPPPVALALRGELEMGKRQSRLHSEEVEELVKTTHCESLYDNRHTYLSLFNHPVTAKELNRWYRGFLRDCPSGTLTEQDFCRIYKQFFPFGDPEEMALLVFRGFGVSARGEGSSEGPGVVGFPEFITTLSTLTRGSVEERLKLIFRLYDSDGDGSLSREDMEGVMEAMYKMIGPLLAQEREENQTSDEEEDPSLALSARVKGIFNTMDKSGEGRVGLDQFMEAVKEDSSMTLALQHQQQLLL